MNRERRKNGLPPIIKSRIKVTSRVYKYSGKHVNPKKARKFKGELGKRMEVALLKKMKRGAKVRGLKVKV